MRGVAVILAAASVTACVKVPDFQYRDGGTSDGDDAAMDDGGTTEGGARIDEVSGAVIASVPGLYEMGFSTLGYHFPYTFRIGDTFVQGAGGTACTQEQGTGVAYYPAYNFHGADTGDLDTDDRITVDVAGPPIAKVRLDWAASLASPCSAQPSGRTTFTFFPDGRITRMDVARMATATSSADCSCAGAANWIVTSYTSFSTGVTSTITNASIPTQNGQSIPATGRPICLRGFGDAWYLAMGWYALSGGVRTRRVVDSVVVVADLLNSSPSSIGPGPVADAVTTMWVGTGPTASCGDLINDVMPYENNPSLEVDNGTGAVTIGMAQDGIYGGETSQDPDPGYDPGTTFTLRSPGTSTVPAFAFWLDTGGKTVTSITRTPVSTTTPWYVDQPLTIANHRLLWFPDGLGPDDEITVVMQ